MIILINIKSNYRTYQGLAPLGLLYVGGALKVSGFEVKIYHISFEEIYEIIDEIILSKPLFIGFSVFSGNPTKWSAVMSLEVKKREPSIPIAWGGIHPSLLPHQCLAENFIDYVIIGEGEETTVELADAIKGNKDPYGIKGIGLKKNGKAVLTETRDKIKEIDRYRLDWSLIDIDKVIYYTDGMKTLNYITSRGCPSSCGFCYNEAFNGRKWRAHSLSHVIDGLNEIKKYGIEAVHFNDDQFFGNPKRALEILRYLQEIGITILVCNVRLDSLDDEILSSIVELGVKRLFVGWESGCDRILKLIGKKVTKKDILEKFKMISRYPVKIDGGGIIGFPTESWEEIEETIDFAIQLVDIVPATVLNMGTYLPYPGTRLYDLAIKEGFIPPNNLFDWEGFDMFHGNMRLIWLKWAKEDQQRVFIIIDKYAKLLEHSKSDSFLKTIGKYILFYMSRFRLQKRYFLFPFEVYLYYKYKNWDTNLLGR